MYHSHQDNQIPLMDSPAHYVRFSDPTTSFSVVDPRLDSLKQQQIIILPTFAALSTKGPSVWKRFVSYPDAPIILV
ncbi:hypothetical protein TNCV_3089981 [Trichonephila clavipes]|nr:hypothetical protein TNCV_3089981 [Trichonephila clavipes]